MIYSIRKLAAGLCADIIPGYADTRRSNREGGDLLLLQGRDFDSRGQIRWDTLDHVEGGAAATRAILQDSDVLITTRTTAPRAIQITGPIPPVVASGHFAILRPRREVIDPRYLCWWLNTNATRERLRAAMRGSAMPFLSARDLAAFEVTVPPLDRQRLIARVHALRRQAADLTERLDHSLDLLLDAASRGATS